MEKLLTNYLFQYRICPLPSLGSLNLHAGYAGVVAGEKKIVAPSPYIIFDGAARSPEHLLTFIAHVYQENTEEAAARLDEFCNQLKSLSQEIELPFADAGVFYKNEDAVLAFKSAEVTPAFIPSIKAERVIRTNVAHHMVVGDKETDTSTMSQQLNESTAISRNRWWIAAIIIGLLALGIVMLYIFQDNNGLFGNAQTVEANSAVPTYLSP